jgi:hypothetical protein
LTPVGNVMMRYTAQATTTLDALREELATVRQRGPIGQPFGLTAAVFTEPGAQFGFR